MLINKDCKLAVVHPTKEFISRLSLYFPFWSKVLHNLRKQLYPNITDDHKSCDLASKTRNAKATENSEAMKKAISCSSILPSENTAGMALTNTFTGKTASPSQQKDMLTFRAIGQADFDAFVKYTYLGSPSVQPVAKSHRLKTFATARVTKRLVNQLQKEKSLVTKCLRSRLMWSQMHGKSGEAPQQQFLELPRAIATESGIPNKGQKSNTTAFYLARYGEQAILNAFPSGWLPDIVILEGMFMINTVPLRIHTHLCHFTRFLLVRYAGWYISAGVPEIHIIFDNPGRFPVHPRIIEQAQRDASLILNMTIYPSQTR